MCLQRCHVGNFKSLFPKFIFALQTLCPLPNEMMMLFTVMCFQVSRDSFSGFGVQLFVTEKCVFLTDCAHGFPQSAIPAWVITGLSF